MDHVAAEITPAVWTGGLSPVQDEGPNAAAVTAPPPGWPTGLSGRWARFTNWSEQIAPAAPLWTATPATGANAAQICDWAAREGWTVRAVGKAHNWAPLAIDPTQDLSHVVLVDTSSLTSAAFVPPEAGRPAAGRFGVGCTVGQVTAFLQEQTPTSYSLLNMTAPGELSLGGVLAIGGHGTGVPLPDEPELGGSLSNLILSLTAIVYDTATQHYREQTFDRSATATPALLAHLGRALITEVTLAAIPDYHLQVTNVWSADDPLYHQSGPESLSGLLKANGRIEAIWWPFAWRSWVKVWRKTATPIQPQVAGPYNYGWANDIPKLASDGLRDVCCADPSKGWWLDLMGPAVAEYETTGVTLNGTARNLLLYVQPDTFRYTMLGYALHVHQDRVQDAISAWITELRQRLTSAESKGQYPINGPIEIRITSTDNAEPLGVPGARPPLLAPSSPTQSAWSEDVVVLWVDLLTFPGTPGSAEFLTDFEDWMRTHWASFGSGPNALRPEWSKAWGYTAQGPWTAAWIGTDLPGRYPGFLEARGILQGLDPARIFTSPLLEQLGL